jgi:glyoxylase-like metal-dependent hydrolase (beta-lactamase superfamily II)
MSPDPYRVLLAPNPSPMTLDGTRSVLLGRERPVVIDPGPADPRHLERLRRALAGHRPVAILLTHHHPDHAAAAPLLAAATGAPVLMAAGAVDVGFAPIHAARWIGDGEVVETDVGAVRAVSTPGHAPEHLAFLWTAPGGGVLFVGDLLMGVGDTTLVAPPEGDLDAYLRSLHRVREVGASVLVPAHGPPLDDPPAAIERYLRHRDERVARLVEALRQLGPTTPADLVDRIYGAALDPRLRAAAEGSLRAMLHYLRERERVEPLEGDRFALVPGPHPDSRTHAPSTT